MVIAGAGRVFLQDLSLPKGGLVAQGLQLCLELQLSEGARAKVLMSRESMDVVTVGDRMWLS